MAGMTVTGLKLILKGLMVAPAIYEKLRAWKGKPSKEDRQRLIRYARRLDERRVFSADFNVEVVEACVGSLAIVTEYTDEMLAEIEHAAARAVVASILDCVRQFLDRWGSYHTPRHWERPTPGRDHEEFPQFFKDLGELRGKMKLLVGMLTELEPQAVAPGLTTDHSDHRQLQGGRKHHRQ